MTSLTPEARALLEAGCDAEEPLDDVTRARMKRRITAVAVGGAATATATSAAAAGASKVGAANVAGGSLAAVPATGLSLLTKIGFAVSVVAATSVGAVLTSEAPAPSPAPVTTAAAPRPGPAAAPVVDDDEGRSALQGDRIDDDPTPDGDPERSTSGSPAAPHTVSAPAEVAPPAGSSLAEETAQLRRAQRELQQGDPERALELLEGHEGGVLQEEREAARVLALCRAGRLDEGRGAQRRFLTAHPRSPHRSRVLAACR